MTPYSTGSTRIHHPAHDIFAKVVTMVTQATPEALGRFRAFFEDHIGASSPSSRPLGSLSGTWPFYTTLSVLNPVLPIQFQPFPVTETRHITGNRLSQTSLVKPPRAQQFRRPLRLWEALDQRERPSCGGGGGGGGGRPVPPG